MDSRFTFDGWGARGQLRRHGALSTCCVELHRRGFVLLVNDNNDNPLQIGTQFVMLQLPLVKDENTSVLVLQPAGGTVGTQQPPSAAGEPSGGKSIWVILAWIIVTCALMVLLAALTSAGGLVLGH
mmetsp:Transcript_20858/g.48477  ORF Transcript_20858/g.48477 Transcript_20858/m.48477 type:complete len:126 (-) Transcript_20858:27-404(-)